MQTFNVAGTAAMASARRTQPRPEITVRVFNYAGVRPDAMARAEREVIKGTGASQVQQPGRLTIQVYNIVQAPPRTIARAEGEAARILQRAGLTTSWVDCPRTSAKVHSTGICAGGLTPDTLMMRIIDRLMPTSAGERMGFAVPDLTGGIYAAVSYPRIERIAHGSLAGVDILLGALMAHEIGHLLLGNLNHSATGIMCGRWKKRELELVGLQSLLFTNGEGEAMRMEVARRCAAQSLKSNKPGESANQ
jgi:hypothetical protein